MRYYVESQSDGTFLGSCDDFEYITDAIGDSFSEALQLIQDMVEREHDEAEPSADWY